MSIRKRILYLTLDSKEPVHLEVISTEEEINKLINLLETAYKFKCFSVVPIKAEE